jgi:hypothetical protein
MLADAPGSIDLAREALALAEGLQLHELVAQALVTLGAARWKSGDLAGVQDCQRGLDIALAHNALSAAFRGYNNLALFAGNRGSSDERIELLKKAERVGQRLGDPEQTKYVQAQLIAGAWARGDWDAASARTDRLIAECEAGPGHVQEAWLRMLRARARIARDDEAGALDDVEKALEAARRNAFPETLIQTLGEAVEHYARLGRIDEARKIAEEARSFDRDLTARYLIFKLAWDKELLGIDLAELESYLDHLPREDEEARESRLIIAGKFTELADKLRGLPQFEADVRLRAAQELTRQGKPADAAAQAEEALVFYRSVRATRFIREAEALLEEIHSTVR